MSRIIKPAPPPKPPVEKRKTCGACKAVVGYVPDDVKRYSGTDRMGGPDGCEWIVCPACGVDIMLKSW